LSEQKRSGKKLGMVIIENAMANEEQIAQGLARQLNAAYVNLKVYNLKPNTVKLLPEARARRFRAIVLEEKPNALLVGMVDPTDIFAYDELVKVLKKPIELAVVNEAMLLEQISRLYRKTDEITDFARALKAEIGDATFDFGINV